MKQRGMALVTAIFLLVLLAGLGAAIVSMSTTSQKRAALDVMGARAYQAARSGVEWGLYQALIVNGCAGSTNVTFPNAAVTLGPNAPTPFTVTVQCVVTADANGGPAVRTITATACNRPINAGSCPGLVGMNYVERQITVTF